MSFLYFTSRWWRRRQHFRLSFAHVAFMCMWSGKTLGCHQRGNAWSGRPLHADSSPWRRKCDFESFSELSEPLRLEGFGEEVGEHFGARNELHGNFFGSKEIAKVMIAMVGVFAVLCW